MRLRVLVASVFAFSLPAVAQSPDDVNRVLDVIFGDHAKFESAFAALQEAVAEEDAEAVAALAAYPLVVKVDERREVGSAEAFVSLYDQIMTDEIVTVIAEQEYGSLFASDQGIMFGRGEVWMSGVCEDDSCAVWDVRIITIQSAEP